jgi:hypothetical protein
MGTRHLITIVKDGEFKLAQYGQWDGYPSGQGLDLLEFLSGGQGNIDALKRNVDQLLFVSDEEQDALYQTVGIPAGQEWVNMEQSKAIKEAFPSLHRDTGAGILELIASGKINNKDPHKIVTFEAWLFEGRPRIPTVNNIAFAGGWGCEWAYAIDLDKDTFEVYEAGMGNEGDHNRFTDVIKKEYEGAEEGPCFVQLVGEYKLDALPSWEQFLEELEPEALERHREWRARAAAEEQATDADEDAAPAADGDNDGDKPIWSM